MWDQHVELLPRCLRAIANERVPATVVIIDNASTVPIETPNGASTITLPERQSIGAARNAALDRTTTRYVLFADADDEVAPGSLRRSLALLERNGSTPGVLGRSIVDEPGQRRRRGRTPSPWFLRASRHTPQLAPLFWLFAFQCSITSTILRTATVRDAGGFADADIGEDWHLAARLARRGHFICIDDAVRIYHRHAAAARTTSVNHPSTDRLRRAVCRDCLADPYATSLQRRTASALLRRRS